MAALVLLDESGSLASYYYSSRAEVVESISLIGGATSCTVSISNFSRFYDDSFSLIYSLFR